MWRPLLCCFAFSFLLFVFCTFSVWHLREGANYKRCHISNLIIHTIHILIWERNRKCAQTPKFQTWSTNADTEHSQYVGDSVLHNSKKSDLLLIYLRIEYSGDTFKDTFMLYCHRFITS